MLIVMSEEWSRVSNEIESILKSQVLQIANEEGIPFVFVTDSKAIQESIEMIAHKFGDFVDHLKKDENKVEEWKEPKKKRVKKG